jgi:hypothetical protein
MYSVLAPIWREICRDGVRKIKMAKEIKRDVGVRWKEIKKCTVPVCRDPVFCFKTLIFTKTSPKCLFSFQSVLCAQRGRYRLVLGELNLEVVSENRVCIDT